MTRRLLALSLLPLALACPPRDVAVPASPVAAPVPGGSGQAPDPLRVATWNIEWLNRADDFGPNPRLQDDYARLATYVDLVGADIFVVQEVDGPDAAQRVFDPAVWDMHFADQDIEQRVGVIWRRDLPVTVNADYDALDVGGVREGVDVTIDLGTQQLRLLGVHMKSGCWGDDYTMAPSDACEKFARQVPRLEAWVDARMAEGVPFVVVGDFNRRLNPTDALWVELDDGEPGGVDLVLATEGHRQQCWGSRYPELIDHFVLGGAAGTWYDPASYRETTYLAEHGELEDVLSDHCPLAIALDW